MKQPIWPFRSCATPADLLTALRKALPCKFPKWTASWWTDGTTRLVVNLRYKPRHGDLSFIDLASTDNYRRHERRDQRVRRFPGFTHLSWSTAGYGHATFHVALTRLPKIRQLAELRMRLEQARSTDLQRDARVAELDREIDRTQRARAERLERVKQAHDSKHAAEYERIAALRGGA